MVGTLVGVVGVLSGEEEAVKENLPHLKSSNVSSLMVWYNGDSSGLYEYILCFLSEITKPVGNLSSDRPSLHVIYISDLYYCCHQHV